MSAAKPSERHALKHVAVHLLIPLFLGVGMALAYLGAFHQPSPQGVRVDVVGTSTQSKVIAGTLQDKLGSAVSVRTIPNEATAVSLIEHRELSAALVPSPTKPTLLYTSAASATTSSVVVSIFTAVANSQNLPLQLNDVVPVAAAGDPSGQSIFFWLVGMTVGSYAAGVAIGAAGGALRLRKRIGLAVASSFATSALVAVVAGPIYHALPTHRMELFLLAWVYSLGIQLIGTGLHPFIGKLTTPVMTGLFVMLNFTTCGGIYAAELQPGFFGALHSFWNGAALMEAGRDMIYFPALGITRQVITLFLWLAAGLALVTAAGITERRRAAARHVAAQVETAEEEELEEVVAA